MTRQQLQKDEVTKITSIYRPEDYKTYNEAMEQLEMIARNQGLPEKIKTTFNRNFYSYVKLTAKHFNLDFDLFKDVAEGISKLDALPVTDKDSIVLIGDDEKYCFKLLDTEGKYGSTFKPESGKCKYPSHWFKFYHVIMANEL